MKAIEGVVVVHEHLKEFFEGFLLVMDVVLDFPMNLLVLMMVIMVVMNYR